jgi:hypothetical protein
MQKPKIMFFGVVYISYEHKKKACLSLCNVNIINKQPVEYAKQQGLCWENMCASK